MKKYIAILMSFVILVGSLVVSGTFNVFASEYATIEYYDTNGTLLKKENGTPNSKAPDYEPISATKKLIAFYTDEALTNEFDGMFGEEGSVTKVYADWYKSISDFVNNGTPYSQNSLKVGASGNTKVNHIRWGVDKTEGDGMLKYSFTYNPDTNIGGKVGSAYGKAGSTPTPVAILNDDGTHYKLSPYTTYRLEFDYKVVEVDTVNSPEGLIIRADRAHRDNIVNNERRLVEFDVTYAGYKGYKFDLDDQLDGNSDKEDEIVSDELVIATAPTDGWQTASYKFTTFDWENRQSAVDTSLWDTLVLQGAGYGVAYIDNIRIIEESSATKYTVYDVDGTTVLKEDFGFPNSTVTLETPERPQKTLLGFYSEIACKTKVESIDLGLPSGEYKVYTKWDSDNPVIFNLNNGFAAVPYTLNEFSDLPSIDTFIKMCDYNEADFEGMEFLGWYSSTGELIKTVSKASTRANNKIYAAWSYSEDKSDSYSSVSLWSNMRSTVAKSALYPQSVYEADITFGSSVQSLKFDIYAGTALEANVLDNVNVSDSYTVKVLFKTDSVGALADFAVKSNRRVTVKSLTLKRLSGSSSLEKYDTLSLKNTLSKGINRLVVYPKVALDFDYQNSLVKSTPFDGYYVVPTGLMIDGTKLFVNPEIEKIQANDTQNSTNIISGTDSGAEYKFNVTENDETQVTVNLAKENDSTGFGVVGALKAGDTDNALRFVIRVAANNTNTVTYNGGVFSVKERGAIVATRSGAAYDQLVINGKDTIKLVANQNIYNTTNSYFDYSVKVSGINGSYKERTVVCRAYMVLADANGNEFVVYSANALATNYNYVLAGNSGKYVEIEKGFDFSSADYTITYPKYNTSYLVVMRLEELVEQIKEKYGITIALQKDTSDSAKEILIGNTERSVNYEIADNKYGISLNGQKLQLLGNSPEALISAIDEVYAYIMNGNVLRNGFTYTDKIDDIGDKEINDYREIWTDNFDSDYIDSIWSVYDEFDYYEECNIDASKPFKMFRSADKEHILLKDGKLNQFISKNSNYHIESVKMTTKDNLWFKYGYTEISAKLPAEEGIGAGFWLVATGEEDGDIFPEFDILESFGNPKYYKATPLRNRQSGQAMDIDQMDSENVVVTGNTWVECPGEDDEIFNDAYHTIGLEWTETYFNYILDGEVVYSIDYSNSQIIKDFFEENPVHLIISSAANKEWWIKDTWNGKGSMANENTDWTYGSQYSVEYVHLYQKAGQYNGVSKEAVLNPKNIYGDWVGGVVIN